MNQVDLMIDVEEVPDFDELVEQAPQLDPDEAVRRLLLRLAELEARYEQVKHQRERILDLYTAKLATIDAQVGQARDSIYACVVRKGERVVWPDLGTAYLTTRRPSIRVLAPDLFEEWALAHGHVKEIVDAKSAKAAALESVLTDGVLPEGAEFVPESQTLTLRMAHLEKA